MAQGRKWRITKRELEDLTSRFTDEEIASMYSVTVSTVWKARKEHNVLSFKEKCNSKKNRKTGALLSHGTGSPHCTTDSQNNHYFDKIDTEEKAYYLGLLLAEGNVSDNKTGCTVGLSLSDPDGEIVHRFKKALRANRTVRIQQRLGKKPANVLIFQGRYLVERLIDLGVTLNTEEHTLRKPDQIPRSLRRHLVRGFVDGDGSINITGRYFYIGSCSKDMLEIIKYWIECQFQKKLSLITSAMLNSGKNFWKLSPGGGEPLTVLGLLYDDSTICFQRKFEAYAQWKVEIDDSIKAKEDSDPLHGFHLELQELIASKINGTIRRGAQQELADKAGVSKSMVSKRLKKTNTRGRPIELSSSNTQ